ncbi:MAG TPA: hypothetical protein EYM68_02950 [Gammaproteobacteria bacterium]|nr:hypothetical protein [Gammaproteobacteria bacterium]
MTRIHTLIIEPMSEESFEPFGELWCASKKPSDRRILSPTSYSHDGQSTVHVIWQPQGGLKFDQLERHFGVTQSFVQLSGGAAVVCAAAPTDPDNLHHIPPPEAVRAFLIDPSTGYSFKRGTWHSLNRHILDHHGATFLILNSNPNPTQMVNYQTGSGCLSRDLDVDQNPEILKYGNASGIVFEIKIEA